MLDTLVATTAAAAAVAIAVAAAQLPQAPALKNMTSTFNVKYSERRLALKVLHTWAETFDANSIAVGE